MHCPLSMQEFFGIGSKVSSSSLKHPAGKVEVNIGDLKLFTVVFTMSFDFFLFEQKNPENGANFNYSNKILLYLKSYIKASSTPKPSSFVLI